MPNVAAGIAMGHGFLDEAGAGKFLDQYLLSLLFPHHTKARNVDYKVIEEDIAKFMDPTQIQFMLTEVPEIIKDGPTS